MDTKKKRIVLGFISIEIHIVEISRRHVFINCSLIDSKYGHL